LWAHALFAPLTKIEAMPLHFPKAGSVPEFVKPSATAEAAKMIFTI